MTYKRYRSVKSSRDSAPIDSLAVIISGKRAGTLRLHPGKYHSFVYNAGYNGPDLSVGIRKLAGLAHYDDVVTPFIFGLIPDSPAVRTRMAHDIGSKPNDAFALLKHYGKDCPGAVQVCEPDEADETMAGMGRYEPIADSEIRVRLTESMATTEPEWHGRDESWSLGGNQGKIALASIDGIWHRCIGARASTHILKPGVNGMPLQALVEFATMKLAHAVGLSVARCEYLEFDGMPAISVERYDRRVDDQGNVFRIHQEDICQALHVMPARKYEPGSEDIIPLLGEVASTGSIRRFVEGLFFNYLVGGIDAHAKNYSLVHLHDSVELAPLYDLASVLPYQKVTSKKYRTTPMSIGGERRIGMMRGSTIERFATKFGLSPDGCKRLMKAMAERILDAMPSIRDDYRHIEGMSAIMPDFEATISTNCKAMLANIDADGKTMRRIGLARINGGSIPRTGSPVLSDADVAGLAPDGPRKPEGR